MTSWLSGVVLVSRLNSDVIPTIQTDYWGGWRWIPISVAAAAGPVPGWWFWDNHCYVPGMVRELMETVVFCVW